MAVLERRQPSVTVRCDCGTTFELATRNVQRYRAEGREPRCRSCHWPRKPLTAEERTRYERFWVEQLGSRDACRELADLIWGP